MRGTTPEQRAEYRQEYKAWVSMRSRCRSVKDSNYKNYGGRGIKINPSWVDSFHAFIGDVGPVPDALTKWSLERLDVNGNYEPGNVVWETYARQARNRRMQSRNKTGETGVMLVDKAGRDCFVAFWSDSSGKCKTKTFSCSKYGDEEAKNMAVSYRAEMIRLLNLEGAGYSEGHGK